MKPLFNQAVFSQENEHYPQHTAVNKVNILLIDHKTENFNRLNAIISNQNILYASTFGEANELILQYDYALIFINALLPGLSPFNVSQILKQQSHFEATPIIFLTANVDEFRFLAKDYELGMVDYLQKPLDPIIARAKVAVYTNLYLKSEQLKSQNRIIGDLQTRESGHDCDCIAYSGKRAYEELAESIPQIVFSVDHFGNTAYFNQRWFQYTGLSPSQSVSSLNPASAIHPNDLEFFNQCWKKPRTRGESVEVEIRLREKKSGAFRWHLLRATPEFSNQGQFLGWLGTLTEIHIHKRSQENKEILTDLSNLLAMSNDCETALKILAERLANSIADVCIIDLALPHRDFIRIARHKCKTDSVVEHHSVDNYSAWEHFSSALLGVNQLDQAKNRGALALETGRPILASEYCEAELWNKFCSNLTKLCGCHDLESTISAPIFFQGCLTGSISMIKRKGPSSLESIDLELLTDLCQHITLALQKISLYEQSLENNRRKDQFLAVLSHELRTPLNAILGWTELVKEDCHKPKTLESLDIIERNGKVLGHLVGDLLEVSRIITGKLELNRKELDIKSVLLNAVSTLMPQVNDKNISLIVDAPDDLPLHKADQARLEQVFWNILANAVKFTPTGGQILISAAVQNNLSRIVFKDNGIGIAPNLLPHIFERFRQADSSRTRAHSGLGLGLSIVKSIVDAHDGHVQVSSLGVGHGATFTIELPISQQESTESISTILKQTNHQANKLLQGRRLVVVDDDWSTRTLLANFLSNSGAVVEQAGSVKDALKILANFDPEAVVTDIGMPYEDGFVLLERLKEHMTERGISIPVAALSAYASNEDADVALAAGFDVYLTKPIRANELVTAVGHLLQHNL